MDVCFLINNKLVVFSESLENAKLLLEDDAFAFSYIERELTAKKLQKYDIFETQLQNLNIERVAQAEDEYNSECDTDGSVWSMRGKMREKDLEATEYFLKLRLSSKYDALFRDKRTVKANIWGQMALEMNNAGYFVGTNKIGAQKCRQKFQNLTKGYISFVRHVNTTGEGKKDPPEHFDLLHAILGDKDKVKLNNIHDSLSLSDLSSLDLSEPQPSTSYDVDIQERDTPSPSLLANVKPRKPQSSCSNNKELGSPQPEKQAEIDNDKDNINRFKNIKKTAKPAVKSELVQTVKQMHEENLQIQNEQFQKLSSIIERQNNLLEEQNKQRNTLIAVFEQMTKKNKKRKRSSSESD